MAASVSIEYDGLKQVLREIQKVDPALRRQITKDIKNAMNPLLSAIKDSIPSSPPLTGQKHNGRTAWKAESKNVVMKVVIVAHFYTCSAQERQRCRLLLEGQLRRRHAHDDPQNLNVL